MTDDTYLSHFKIEWRICTYIYYLNEKKEIISMIRMLLENESEISDDPQMADA